MNVDSIYAIFDQAAVLGVTPMEIQDDNANWVFFAKKNSRWARLPRRHKEELKRAVANVERIRAQIGADAAVSSMPPVQIVDEIWVHPDWSGAIDGRTTPIVVNGSTYFGAQLPAPTILLPDDELIRAVLVHEFTHCFFHMTQVIDAVDAGMSDGVLTLGSDCKDVFSDRDHEDAAMVNPDDWFGRSDAESFLTWHDARFQGPIEEAQIKIILTLKKYLPVKTPNPNFEASSIVVMQDVADHIRMLRNRGYHTKS